jgi:hypothetical protein
MIAPIRDISHAKAASVTLSVKVGGAGRQNLLEAFYRSHE